MQEYLQFRKEYNKLNHFVETRGRMGRFKLKDSIAYFLGPNFPSGTVDRYTERLGVSTRQIATRILQAAEMVFIEQKNTPGPETLEHLIELEKAYYGLD